MKNQSWYNSCGKENDVVISSRIRFARNLKEYPFAARLQENAAKEIIAKISGALDDSFHIVDFSTLSPREARSYVEKHFASPEFVESALPHALALSEDEQVSIMMVEEDHIREQVILPGLALEEAFARAVGVDDLLCGKLEIAFDEKLGYLTHCPTNIGTGMRASVMLFLPALAVTRKLAQVSTYLTKVGLTIRGLYGEGSEADGYLYQISNQITLGTSEEEIIRKLSEVISQIITLEQNARKALRSDNDDALTDRIMRAWGTLHYAHLMPSNECMKLLAAVRLGVAFGIITDIGYEKIGELMIHTLPATLMCDAGKDLGEHERDIARAAYIRKELAYE